MKFFKFIIFSFILVFLPLITVSCIPTRSTFTATSTEEHPTFASYEDLKAIEAYIYTNSEPSETLSLTLEEAINIAVEKKESATHIYIKNSEEQPPSMSLDEAIDMAMQVGEAFYEDLTLTEAHSYDNDKIPSINAGEDGKRQLWFVSLANEKGNHIIFDIREGAIDNIFATEFNSNHGLIDIGQIKMTLKEAVEKAKKLGLRGGNPENEEEWVSGYNFKLEMGSLVESPDDKKIFLDVIGVSKNGNFARVSFYPDTGELFFAEEEIKNEFGDFIWQEF